MVRGDVGGTPKGRDRMKHRTILLAGMLAVTMDAGTARADAPLFSSVRELPVPASVGAGEPMLSAMEDGSILMSWTEPTAQSFAVRIARRDEEGWSEARTVIEANDLFVNWADFPSVIALPDGTLAAHWLREKNGSAYAYDVNIAFSKDEGRSWSAPVTPHDDGTPQQHGFVTMLPVARDRLMAFWLDGRTQGKDNSISDPMQLRSAILGSGSSILDDTLLDASTCSCCQTTATVTESGTVLVAYRDRTADEIRDIAVVRNIDGDWSEPQTVHEDGWRIAGCPVNGPAMDSADGRIAVAWFTAAGDAPRVKVAFSDDEGESFSKAVTLDGGQPMGRVDVLQRADGSALVSWLESTDRGEVFRLCRTRPGSACEASWSYRFGRGGYATGFPRMTDGREGIYIAWGQADRDSSIRVVLGKLEEEE